MYSYNGKIIIYIHTYVCIYVRMYIYNTILNFQKRCKMRLQFIDNAKAFLENKPLLTEVKF